MSGLVVWNKKAQAPCQANVVTHIRKNGVDKEVTLSVTNTYKPNPRNIADINAGKIAYIDAPGILWIIY